MEHARTKVSRPLAEAFVWKRAPLGWILLLAAALAARPGGRKFSASESACPASAIFLGGKETGS